MGKILQNPTNSNSNFHYPLASGDPDGKESACNAGDPGLIPGLERSPGEGNGNPLHYSCLESFLEGGVWQVFGVAKCRTPPSTHTPALPQY